MKATIEIDFVEAKELVRVAATALGVGIEMAVEDLLRKEQKKATKPPKAKGP